MLSPIVGLGFASAGLLLGMIPSGLCATEALWTALLKRDGPPRDFVRRILLISTVMVAPVAGWLSQVGGAKDVALAGLLILAIGLTLTSAAPTEKAASTNMMGLGAGIALLAVGLIAWMPAVLGPTDRTVESIVLGSLPTGLGWLIGPATATRTLRWMRPRYALLVTAVWAGITFAILLAVPLPDVIHPAPSAVDDIRFWLVIVALLLYFPIEVCLQRWIEPFLHDLDGRRTASLGRRLAAFWAAYLAGRLVTWWFVRTGLEPWFLLASAGMAAMALGNLSGAYGPSSGATGAMLVGLGYGPLLPGLIGLLAQIFPDRFGAVVGAVLAVGGLLHVGLGPIVSRVSTRRPLREAMRLPVILTILVGLPLLVVALIK